MQSITNAKPVTAAHLIQWGAKQLSGLPEAHAGLVSPPDAPTPDSLVFLKTGVKAGNLGDIAILVVPEGFDMKPIDVGPRTAILSTKDFRGLMSRVLAHFDQKASSFSSGISPDASISKTASLGANVRIGANAVIQDGVVIAQDSWIGSGAVIEAFATIGEHCRIHSNVVVGHHCEIGAYCEIHANTTLGSDGFGFIPQKSGHPTKIPQIGRVVLGDHVEIGANCAIDRAAISETRIGNGTKLDNLCHIAHNCTIGEDGLIAAGFMMAGSSHIGDRFMCGGDVVVADHITITDDVNLGGRSAATKNIEKAGAYAGYPLEPMKDNLRTTANTLELTRLRKDVAELKRLLKTKTDS